MYTFIKLSAITWVSWGMKPSSEGTSTWILNQKLIVFHLQIEIWMDSIFSQRTMTFFICKLYYGISYYTLIRKKCSWVVWKGYYTWYINKIFYHGLDSFDIKENLLFNNHFVFCIDLSEIDKCFYCTYLNEP